MKRFTKVQQIICTVQITTVANNHVPKVEITD